MNYFNCLIHNIHTKPRPSKSQYPIKENSANTYFENNFLDSQTRGCRACKALFGKNSPSGEVLLVVKNPKQVQLQDLFNILLSIPDLFPSSLDYTSQKVLLCFSHTVCLLFKIIFSQLDYNWWLYIYFRTLDYSKCRSFRNS